MFWARAEWSGHVWPTAAVDPSINDAVNANVPNASNTRRFSHRLPASFTILERLRCSDSIFIGYGTTVYKRVI